MCYPTKGACHGHAPVNRTKKGYNESSVGDLKGKINFVEPSKNLGDPPNLNKLTILALACIL